jgi:hypothetical protein
VSVHDSREFVVLIDEKDEAVKVDSAYVGDYKDEILRLFLGIRVHVCARAFRNKPLTEEEKVGNMSFTKIISPSKTCIMTRYAHHPNCLAAMPNHTSGHKRLTKTISGVSTSHKFKAP